MQSAIGVANRVKPLRINVENIEYNSFFLTHDKIIDLHQDFKKFEIYGLDVEWAKG